MADEALRTPVELKNCRFVRTSKIEQFARFLLQTEPGTFRPDQEFGCRAPVFRPEYSENPIRDIRNHIEKQFDRYLGIAVKVDVTERVETTSASYRCSVTALIPGGERFHFTWEF